MDKMREEFEKYVKNNFICSDDSLNRTNMGVYYNYVYSKFDNYDSCSVSSIWKVWQASRAALVVELPPEHEQAYGAYDGIELRHALQQVGIKYE